MKRLARLLFAAYLTAFLTISGMSAAHAELQIDEMRELLQKSLTITQIDAEITRIGEEETKVSASLRKAEADMKEQQAHVDRTRERLGQVLRAYYKGDRESLWLLVFRAKSFSQMLTFYDYLTYLYRSDRTALVGYREEYAKLLESHRQLELVQMELASLKAEFIRQRERMIAIQEEIDRKLEEHPDAAAVLAQQMAAVQASWKEKGLPLFQQYFSAMSEAMQKLPEKIISDKEKHYIKGTSLDISDADLTRMLHEEKAELGNLVLTFADGQFQAESQEGELKAIITGHYTVEEDPNRLQFHVDKLEYNGFLLDETTNRSLEKTYDLSFSPGLVLPMLYAKEVKTDNGLLSIRFQIKF
ncbi:hypothetical protein [Gorillibacterium timonense]|uniref:hypothetical protein n=1 Tax=Gorillibacterium timonense TaxID=1689269 RepID=UPI00071CD84F|nr:hypothetical protein [Gorillibacterium timonense]